MDKEKLKLKNNEKLEETTDEIKMKEIIYLDTKLVNSLLAQIHTGLPTKFTEESSSSDSTSKSITDTTTTTSSLKAALPILAGTVSGNISEAEQLNQVSLVGNKDFKEAVMDDYSLEVLLENLYNKNLIKASDALDGDIITSKDILSAYNFEVLSKTLDFKYLSEFQEDYDEYTEVKEQLENLEKDSEKYKNLIHKMRNNKAYKTQSMQKRSVYAEGMFKNTTIIKIGDYISFCDNENLRLSYPQLFFNGFSNKEFHLLGILISKRVFDNSYVESLKNKPEEILKNVSAIAFQALLQENYIIEIESSNFIVRPIAIYSVMK